MRAVFLNSINFYVSFPRLKDGFGNGIVLRYKERGFLLESVGQHDHSHDGLNTWMIGYMNLVQDILGGVASTRYRTRPF